MPGPAPFAPFPINLDERRSGFRIRIPRKMQANIESVGALERRVDLSVAADAVATEVSQRLARLARETTMPGFRRGKVPMKLVAQTHGAQVHAEVINDKIGEALSDVLTQGNLRIAGRAHIEPHAEPDTGRLAFRATFEVYPEVGTVDVSQVDVQRSVCPVGDNEVEKTIAVMRRQRSHFDLVERAAADGDLVTIDFHGVIDGNAFPGGAAEDFRFELGAGRMLPEFEGAVRGMTKGETRSVAVTFPDDYFGKDVAGKTAHFDITLKEVRERALPELDGEFARQLGIADGDLDRMRVEVRANVEREVTARLRRRTRDSVMDALERVARFDLPRALVAEEQESLRSMAQAEIAARGGKEYPALEVFAAAAERRVRISLVVGEIIRAQKLHATRDQVRQTLEAIAGSYERPGEVMQWYLGNRERMAEVEAAVLEDNVVEWVLQHAKVSDLAVSFDELMEAAKG